MVLRSGILVTGTVMARRSPPCVLLSVHLVQRYPSNCYIDGAVFFPPVLLLSLPLGIILQWYSNSTAPPPCVIVEPPPGLDRKAHPALHFLHAKYL